MKPWLAALLNILPPLAFLIYVWLQIWQDEYPFQALLLIASLTFGLGYLYLRPPGRFALAAIGGFGAMLIGVMIYFIWLSYGESFGWPRFDGYGDPPGWYTILGVVLPAMPFFLLAAFTAWNAWELDRREV